MTSSPRKLLVVAAVAAITGFSAFSIAEDKANPAMPDRAAIPAAEGAIAVDTMTANFTVTSLDKEKRTVTLKGEDGELHTIKAGKNVRNFDQINVGDRVRATLTDEIAIDVRPAGGPPRAADAGMVALAPKGDKPGVLIAYTDEMTAKVTSVDADKHTLTIETPAGKSKTIKVAPRVDLTALKAGDDITVQWAQALSVIVTSPDGARPAADVQPGDKQ